MRGRKTCSDQAFRVVDAVGRLSNLVGPLPEADAEACPPLIVKPIRRQRRLKPDQVDDLVVMYESGLSVNELASQVMIHRTTVMAHLSRRGVKTRRNTRKLDDDQVRRAVALYEYGRSLAGVGTAFAVSAEVVRQTLIDVGIERRSRGRRRRGGAGGAT